MSWHYLRGPAGESSEDCCTGGTPLPPLKSKITHAEFCCNGRLTDVYLDSLSGTMCVRSTAGRGRGGSMSSAGVSLAKTFHAPEKGQESQASAADSGKSLQGSFAKWDRDSCSWKTHQCSLFGGLELFSETWPRWGLMQGGVCWGLATPERHTSGSGYGSRQNWPTPQASANENRQTRLTPSQLAGKHGLSLCVAVNMWPTPIAHAGSNRRKKPTPPQAAGKAGMQLAAAVNMRFPTPRAEDSQCAGGHREKDDTLYGAICRPKESNKFGTPRASDAKGLGPIGSKSHSHMLEKGLLCAQTATIETGGSLNPTWVEWLMGWPLGWTDLKPLATGKFRQWLRSHGGC